MTATDDLPPQDLNAEQAVLGGILLSKDALADVMEMLTGREFYKPAHQVIYETAVGLAEAGEPVDSVTVADALTKAGHILRVGGGPYLHTLVQTVPSAANASYYARIVQEKFILRQLQAAGTSIVQLTHSGQHDADELVENARQRLDQIAQNATRGVTPTAFTDLMSEVISDLDSPAEPCVPTGLIDLDAQLDGGMRPGQLIVIGARPGVGKSVLAKEIACNVAARDRCGALLFSLEMSRQAIGQRIAASLSGVRFDAIRRKNVTDIERDRLLHAHAIRRGWDLEVVDVAHIGVTGIRSVARTYQRRLAKRGFTLGVLVVDYLQVMQSHGRVESRQQEVAAFSRGLKLLSKELQVPVVAVCALNRGPEARTDKRPLMSDLRESGALESDADIVILLFRDDDRRPGEIEANVAKHRDGATGMVALSWQGHICKIGNLGRHLHAI
jgi:replicative DNA helicase